MSIATVVADYNLIATDLEGLYRDLHRHPELAHREWRTATLVAERLRDAGYEVTEHVGTTGVVGVLVNGAGPTVLFRADMDALPVAELTGLDYASTDTAITDEGEVAVMHACGHDLHTASLVGAATLLARHRHAWSGTAVFLAQPAEEDATGALSMISDGLTDLIDTPAVCLAQHVLRLPAGQLGVMSGPFLSRGGSMRVTLHGRGAHGSMPQNAIDPVVLAASIVMRLQGIVSREVPPGEFAVVTVGRLVAGTKSNIIADTAVLELNLRAYRPEVWDTLVAGVQRIVRAECAASGVEQDPEFELYDHYPLTSNDPQATARVVQAFRDLLGDQVREIDPQTASEDFSHIPDAFKAPYVYWGLGGTHPRVYRDHLEAGTLASLPANHSPYFAPEVAPTLRAGVVAAVVAMCAWLER